MDTALYISLSIISISILMVLIRLVKGPNLTDRVVALDLFITASIGIICAYSILFNKSVYIDVVVIMALLAFLGTISFSYYYEKQDKK